MYVVSKVWANDDDGTGSEPHVFNDQDTAYEAYLAALDEAINDFIEQGYCSEKDRETILYYAEENVEATEVKTSGTLRFSYLEDCYDFWNANGFDF
jgi:hypothetical protein